jgi:hypothetical protein
MGQVIDGQQARKLPMVRFTVNVDGCRWFIETRLDGDDRYLHSSYDGSFQYRYSGKDRAGQPSQGVLISDPVPYQAPDPYVPVLWLAFCQACYITQNTPRLMPAYSISLVRGELDCEVDLLDQGLRLPSRIVYWNDGYFYRLKRAKLPPPFDNGFKDAEYVVTEKTNMPTIGVVPLGFTLKVFQPKPGAKTATDIGVMQEFSARVETVSGRARSSFVPELPAEKPITFRDFRFVSSNRVYRPAYDSFNYVSNRWLGTEEVKALPQFQQYATNQELRAELRPFAITPRREPIAHRTRNRIILSLALVGAAAIPPLILVIRNNLKRPKQQKQSE